eukprot:CCRYP_020844-RE/>CCRYP_020844-RE protein AED:0.11 eAED:0.11 QI:0/1/0.87/1/0.85/0.62/8/4791/92
MPALQFMLRRSLRPLRGIEASKDPSRKMTKERDAVESCSANVYKGIQTNCLAQFDAVKSCLSENPDEWAKCAAARRELDVCSVKSGLGELQK